MVMYMKSGIICPLDFFFDKAMHIARSFPTRSGVSVFWETSGEGSILAFTYMEFCVPRERASIWSSTHEQGAGALRKMGFGYYYWAMWMSCLAYSLGYISAKVWIIKSTCT